MAPAFREFKRLSQVRSTRWSLILVGFVLTQLWGLQPTQAADDEYRLGIGDRLRISVFDRANLSGTFRVRAPGILSLPFIGKIAAAGKTLSELEHEIAVHLGQRSSAEAPQVNIEIERARPVYILGPVRTPGAYPYVHAMTLLKAIALAGGIRRINANEFNQRLELYRTRERYRQLKDQFALARARQARLIAELQGNGSIAFPVTRLRAYIDQARLSEVLTAERRLFRERQQTLENEINALSKTKANFSAEITAQRSSMVSADKRIRLLDEEIKQFTSPKGTLVVPMARILTLRRLAERIRGDKHSLRGAIAAAKAQIDAINVQILQLRNARRTELTTQIKAVEDLLTRTSIGLEQTRRFLDDADALPAIETARNSSPQAPLGFIYRRENGRLRRIVATASTAIEPDDVVRISPQSGESGAASKGSSLRSTSGGRRAQLPLTEVR